MKANREYELNVRRGGRGPALLAGPDRIDHIEVVEIATGEVALFWDTRPALTRRLARGLRDRPRPARGRRLHREVAPLAGGVSDSAGYLGGQPRAGPA